MSAHDIQWKMKCGLKYYPKWPILPMAVIEGNYIINYLMEKNHTTNQQYTSHQG